MSVRYEWDRETVSPSGDVLDHDHRDRLSEYIQPIAADQRLVLVRDVIDEFDGVVDRGWAYVQNGCLPDRFDDGQVETHRVPKRFAKELDRCSRQK